MKHTILSILSILAFGTSAMAQGDYPLNFDPETLTNSSADRVVSSITFTSDNNTGTVRGWKVSVPIPVYADATSSVVTFKAGETITPSCASRNSTWMYAYVYIDYDNNGNFDIADANPIELVTQSTDGAKGYATIPSFTLPKNLADGDYRVRFKTDWNCTDPGGRYGDKYEDNFINDNRGQIIDFTLRIDNSIKYSLLREETEHCNLYMTDGKTQLPVSLNGMDKISFKVVPMTDYVLDGTIDVISEADTTSFDELPANGIITAPISGNTLIRAHFKQGPDATWQCLFNDEFNQDNECWDTKMWQPNAKSTGVAWSRFNSRDRKDSVVVQNNGYLSLTTKTVDTNTMVTGNIKNVSKYNFTYGRVEARCMVYPHTGNFPAFWMMPAAQKPNYSGSGTWGGWPHSGEIDIMEQINTENKAYHTIHSHYANSASEGGLNQTYQKSANETVEMAGKWHIYTLEWDKEQLRWYVDGKQVHKYDRIAAKDNDDDRQWPFDRPFYVILNQSVGMGTWAANPDFNYQYRMDVDYLRVYQRCEPMNVSEAIAEQTVTARASEGRIIISTACATNVTISNINGSIIYNDTVNGTTSVRVPAGIYIAAGHKLIVKE